MEFPRNWVADNSRLEIRLNIDFSPIFDRSDVEDGKGLRNTQINRSCSQKPRGTYATAKPKDKVVRIHFRFSAVHTKETLRLEYHRFMIDCRIMRHGPFIQVNRSSKDLSRIIFRRYRHTRYLASAMNLLGWNILPRYHHRLMHGGYPWVQPDASVEPPSPQHQYMASEFDP